MVHWKSKSTVDDTLDVFPCHGVGGMVGMLLTGVFAKDVGLMSGSPRTFLVQCGALIFVAVFTFAGVVPALQADRPDHPAESLRRPGSGGPRSEPAWRSHAGHGGRSGGVSACENGVSRSVRAPRLVALAAFVLLAAVHISCRAIRPTCS